MTRSAVAAAVLAAGALVLTAAPAVARQPAPPAGPPSSQQRPPSAAPGGARPAPATGPEQLVVAGDGRSLETVSGAPFFWLGDTAWSLFVNLDRDEVVHYLDDRAAKGFTVIQAVAVSPPSGGLGPSALGDVPFVDDLAEPLVTEGADPGDERAYDYWDHVAFVLDEAAARGMYVALLPAWGRSVAGEELHEGNARAYGEFLGERFGDRTNIVWMMGGDDSDNFRPELWGAVARGITTAVAGAEDHDRTLMTFHPGGGSNSATALDGEPWLDLHTYQSSHTPIEDSDTVWRNLERSYAVDPPKPFLDSEPAYEAHPIAFDAANGYTDDTDVRRIAWVSVFSGAAGHTYGHHNIWMMYGSHRGGKGAAPRDIDWREALDAPGGAQMAHLAALMAEHPAPREPAQDAIRSATFDGEAAAIRAVRAADGSYLLVYSGAGEPFQLDPAAVPEDARATWLDPRTGESVPAEAVATRETTGFEPPTSGEDWVLVLDAPRAAGPAARAGTAPGPAPGTAPPARGTPPGPSGTTPRTPARPPGEPVRILPLGDSITYGYSHGSYRTALYEQLTGAGVAFDFVGGENDGPDDLPDADHEGHSGWRVDEIAERAAGWVAEHEPDVVLLHIGTNDLIQDTPPDEIAVRLDRLLHTLVTTRPGTAVVVATLIPLNGGSPELDEYNDAVRALAAEYARRGHPVRLADMAAAGIGGERDIPDRVHPSPAGYAKMADVWFPEVTAVAGETA